jgi:hypothetical protein
MPGWLLTFHLRLHEFFTPVSKDFVLFQTNSFHFIKWILLKHQLLQHPNRRLVWNAVCITTAFFDCRSLLSLSCFRNIVMFDCCVPSILLQRNSHSFLFDHYRSQK